MSEVEQPRDHRLPPGWEWRSIGTIGESILGVQRSPQRDASGGQVVPYVRVANVQDAYLALDDLLEMPFSDREVDQYVLRPGDILLCEGQSLEHVGRCAQYNGEIDGPVCFQNHVIRFRAGPLVLPDYAFLLMRACYMAGVFAERARATTNIANLGFKRFKDIVLPIPPLAAQEHMAALANEALASISFVRDAASQVETTASSMWESEVGRALPAERMKGDLPHGWRWRTLEEATSAAVVYGITQPGPSVPAGSGVPYIRLEDVEGHEILEESVPECAPEVEERHARSRVRAGDLVLGLVRHPRVAVVPETLDGANINRGLARVRPSPEVDGSFLVWWLRGPVAQGWMYERRRGTSRPMLNVGVAREIPVPVGPLDAQRAIAERLTSGALLVEALCNAAVGAGSRTIGLERQWLVELTRVKIGHDGLSGGTQLQRATPTRGVSVARSRSSRSRRTSILDVLRHSAGGQLSPEDVFAQAGFRDVDVEQFYEELIALIADGHVKEVRRGDDVILAVEGLAS